MLLYSVNFICILLYCIFGVYSDSSTQKLIKEVDNLLPGLCSFFPSKFREVSSSVVHIQAVDALQYDGDHTLRMKTETQGSERLRMHYFLCFFWVFSVAVSVVGSIVVLG